MMTPLCVHPVPAMMWPLESPMTAVLSALCFAASKDTPVMRRPLVWVRMGICQGFPSGPVVKTSCFHCRVQSLVGN